MNEEIKFKKETKSSRKVVVILFAFYLIMVIVIAIQIAKTEGSIAKNEVFLLSFALFSVLISIVSIGFTEHVKRYDLNYNKHLSIGGKHVPSKDFDSRIKKVLLKKMGKIKQHEKTRYTTDLDEATNLLKVIEKEFKVEFFYNYTTQTHIMSVENGKTVSYTVKAASRTVAICVMFMKLYDENYIE
jgi:hypothetical protein